MAEKISCFEMNTMFRNFRALNTFSIYLNIFKIRVLIQITHAKIQMDLSKNSRFSEEEAKSYIPRTKKRRKLPVCEMLEFSETLSSSMLQILSWKLKIIACRGSSTIPSSKLKLLCQYEMTSMSQRAPS